MAAPHCVADALRAPAFWHPAVRMVVAVVVSVAASAARAQTLPADAPQDPQLPVEAVRAGVFHITPALESRVVYTNNPGPDQRTGELHHDTVVEVQPSVVFERRGSHVDLSGNLAGSVIDYLDKSHPRRWLPRGCSEFRR